MAITVEELPEGESGGYGEEFVRTYTRAWRVTMDNATDRPLAIFLSGLLPAPHDPHPTDLGARLKNLTVDRESPNDDPRIWIAKAAYDSKVEEKDENPTKRRPEISGSFEEYKKVVVKDRDGNPVQTSARGNFASPPELEDGYPQIVITRNEKQLDFTAMLDYRYVVNSKAWAGFEAGQCLMKPITWKRVIENTPTGDLIFYQKTYTIQVKEDGWPLELLDQDIMKLDGEGRRVKIVDAKQQPITKPALLDGSGGELAVDGEPKFRKFYVRREADFDKLNLLANL